MSQYYCFHVSVNLMRLIMKVLSSLKNFCWFSAAPVSGAFAHSQAPPMVLGSLSQCFFTLLLFLSAALLKVWCRQSKLNRLFNLFSPCQESLSCEITEQEPRQRSPFKNSHREHPSALAPASAFALVASTLSSWIQTWRQALQSRLTLSPSQERPLLIKHTAFSLIFWRML